MKKIILFAVMVFASVTAFAQPLEPSKFFDNTFVGVSTGVGAWLTPTNKGLDNFGDGIHSVSSVRVGKWFTPSVGGELTYEFGLDARPTFGNSSFTGANFLVNMNNAIGKYKGEPRRVELVAFIGGGWHHTHDAITNNMAARAGTQLNVNMGKKKAWQINVIPSINYILTDNGFSTELTGQPRFDVNRSWVALNVGVTHKFKTSNGTNNFKFTDKLYSQKELDLYLNEIEALKGGFNRTRDALEKSKRHMGQLAHENERLKHALAEALKALSAAKNVPPVAQVVGFQIGKADIAPQNRATLLTIAEVLKHNGNAKVLVTGFADKNTGTAKRNMELSQLRADAVKAELVKLGVDASRVIVEAKGDTVQPFEENDANRVAISLVK